MIYLKGDKVKLKTGEVGIVLDSWGIARDWYKIDTGERNKVLTMECGIESLVERPQNKKKRRV